MTGAEALREAVSLLTAADVSDPAGDARRLLAHVLGPDLPRHALAAALAQDLLPEAAEQFRAVIKARAQRQPVSQIVGGRDFWKHRFIVTRDTLDPRPETETLVEHALSLPWKTVLDMGTGTGAILISLLAEREDAYGQGTDISEAALDVARQNAAAAGVTATLSVSDWYQNVAGRFDLIVSNPPYIALEEMPHLSPEVRGWEPALALTDGGDGLSAYRQIAAGAQAHLTEEGHILCEIGHQQGPAVLDIFARVGALAHVVSDLGGRDRVIAAHFPRH